MMIPNLAYYGAHEALNDTAINARFSRVLESSGLRREFELGQLPPEVGNVARPFSRMASAVLLYNSSVRDLFLEG